MAISFQQHDNYIIRKISLFLAVSPMDFISGLACIAETHPPCPAILIEESTFLDHLALDSLVAASRTRFPHVSFHRFSLERTGMGLTRSGNWGLASRCIWLKTLRKHLNQVVQNEFGVSLRKLHTIVDAVYFTFLGDHVRMILEYCRKCPRILYPHGFDQPRHQQIRDFPFMFQARSHLTALRSLCQIRRRTTAGTGEIFISLLHRLLGLSATCVPYDGTDLVYTFRSSALPIATCYRRLRELRNTLSWLASVPPWRNHIHKMRMIIPENSVVLLLSEYARDPLWDSNRNWAGSHLQLAERTLRKTGADCIVIKAHPRSDGSAAARLYDLFMRSKAGPRVHLFPNELSSLPIEALALAFKFGAACSLGSCSLPSDIGIDVPHFVSFECATMFDAGWIAPFWAVYRDIASMLVDEGMCIDLDA